VQNAVLRLYVVHLSVTLVDEDHIGFKFWKVISRFYRTVIAVVEFKEIFLEAFEVQS